MNPLISIIIPHWNRAELLEESVESVRAQTYPKWEVVIVDDHSACDVWDRVQTLACDARVRVFHRRGALKGPSSCRNEGLVHARGKWVIFLDSDDLLAGWCLGQRLKEVRACPDMDLHVFPALLFRTRPMDCDLLWNRLDDGDDLSRFMGSDPPWCVSSPIWKREALARLGGFNPRIIYGDDADLHARAILNGLHYVKHATATPDCFIRRGDQGRITGALDSERVRSRLVRLEEMQKLVDRHSPSFTLRDVWSGEYFTEAEYLLYNAPRPWSAIQAVLSLWRSRMPATWWSRALILFYFRLGAACRDRCYLAVRIMRRMCMCLLPRSYFVRTTTFQSIHFFHMDRLQRAGDEPC